VAPLVCWFPSPSSACSHGCAGPQGRPQKRSGADESNCGHTAHLASLDRKPDELAAAGSSRSPFGGAVPVWALASVCMPQAAEPTYPDVSQQRPTFPPSRSMTWSQRPIGPQQNACASTFDRQGTSWCRRRRTTDRVPWPFCAARRSHQRAFQRPFVARVIVGGRRVIGAVAPHDFAGYRASQLSA
jgi:hypothetical protein